MLNRPASALTSLPCFGHCLRFRSDIPGLQHSLSVTGLECGCTKSVYVFYAACLPQLLLVDTEREAVDLLS
jgi:hypothetical protein